MCSRQTVCPSMKSPTERGFRQLRISRLPESWMRILGSHMRCLRDRKRQSIGWRIEVGVAGGGGDRQVIVRHCSLASPPLPGTPKSLPGTPHKSTHQAISLSLATKTRQARLVGRVSDKLIKTSIDEPSQNPVVILAFDLEC